MSRTRVGKMVPLAKMLPLARALAQLPGQPTAEEAETTLAIPGAYFWAAQMAAVIRPLIVRARRQAFGSQEPPFDTADQVNDWLRRVYYSAQEPQANMDGKALAAAEAVKTVARRITEWTGWRETAALGLILLRDYKVPDHFQARLEGPTPGDQAFGDELDVLPGMDYSLLFRRITLTLRPWHILRPGGAQKMLDHALKAFGPALPRGLAPGRKRPRRGIEKPLSDRNLLLANVIAVMGIMPPESTGPGYKSGGKPYWAQAYRRWRTFGGSKCQPAALAKRWERLPPSVKHALRVSLSAQIPEHQESDST